MCRYSHSTHRSREDGSVPSGKIGTTSPISTIALAQPGWASMATHPSGSVPWRIR